MDLWLRFGFASQAARVAATSVFGECLRWAASRDHTLKESLSSTGHATGPDSRTIHPDPETRCSCRTVACYRRVCLSSLRLPDFIVTFRCGRPTRHSSASSWAGFRTNWMSGAFVQKVELQ